MLTLEQIRSLESKVNKAVSLLSGFQEENRILKSRLSQYEQRIEELEFMIEEFKEEQGEIEQGIMSALEHLDSLESAVGGLNKPAPQSRPAAAPVPTEAAPASSVEEVTAPGNYAETVIEEEAFGFDSSGDDVTAPAESDKSGHQAEQLDIF